jgi:polysaccharide biosynthesis transport protein
MEPSRNLPAIVHSAPVAVWRADSESDRIPGEGPGLSLGQIIANCRAYWKVTVIIASVMVVAAGAFAHLIPRSYKATSTLIVNYDVNDPLAGREIPIALLGNYMATQTELMQSPEILDRVIERLGLTSVPQFSAGNTGGPERLHDWVETQLRKNLDIEQGHAGSQLIYVSAWAHSPTLAADIANAVADAYTAQHFDRMSGPASERAKRYTEELAGLKSKVAVAQESLTKLRMRTGDLDLDPKSDVDGDVLTNLEHRLLEVQNARRTSQARVSSDPNGSSQALSSDLVKTLRGEAAELKSKMAKLRTTFGPKHPQVIELQSQIDSNQQALAAAVRSYSVASAQDVNAAQREESELQSAIQAQRRKILESRQVRDEAAKYQLELESAQSVYKRALEGYDQIMFASSGQYSNVSLVSRARPPADPAKRKTMVILAMGALGGLGLGVLVPLLYEALHRRIRCRDDFERELGVPVLTEFDSTPALRGAT